MSENTTNSSVNESSDGAASSIRQLVDEIFSGNIDEAALALGRTPDQVAAFLSGDEQIDEDTEMKANGIRTVRGDDASAKAAQSENAERREHSEAEGDAPENSKSSDEPSGGNSADNVEGGGQSRAQGTYL